ncbi:MAG: YfcC family protein [Proteobacteria bacterium]|nr:YfcC family protein [Pseudomonadota bacterium]
MERKETIIGLRTLITTAAILGIMIVVAGSFSYFIQAGKLDMVVEGGKRLPVYETVAQTPVPIWKIALSPLFCLTGKNGITVIVIVLFILVIGGSFSIMNRSGFLPGIVTDLVRRFSSNKTMFLVVNVVAFSLMGSCLGIVEEIVPLILIFVPLAYRMGWDSITGVAIPLLSTGIGFAAATFNPFTVGTAQRLAGIPLFSGLHFRIPVYIVSTCLVVLFMLYYTRKIEKNPEKSATYDEDRKIKRTMNLEVSLEGKPTNQAAVAWMIFCFLLVAGVVVGGTQVKPLQDLAFPLIMLIFLIMGIGTGLFSGSKVKKVLGYFKTGVLEFAPAIILVLMAASVGYLVDEGNVLDTILYNLSNMAGNFGKETAILIIYGFQMLMNALVPSGSGQAFLTIPILAPLGDLLNISRQTIVLAYQFGDGFSNLIWPTNPMLIVAIGLGRVSYKAWFKWVLPIQLMLVAVCSIALLIAVRINLT